MRDFQVAIAVGALLVGATPARAFAVGAIPEIDVAAGYSPPSGPRYSETASTSPTSPTSHNTTGSERERTLATVAASATPGSRKALRAAQGQLVLDPWEDGQPLDTGIGEYLVGTYSDDMLADYLLNQTALLNESACPAAQIWVEMLDVIVPDPCEPKGIWSAPNDDGSTNLMNWSESCDLSTPGLAAVLTYRGAGGAVIASSEEALTLTGTKYRLRDCHGNVAYVLQEKVYKVKNKKDPSRCKEYGSCDGSIFHQYFIRGATGAVVAKTGWMRLFAEEFRVRGRSGAPIATVKRAPGWSPTSQNCGDPAKRWKVQFHTSVNTMDSDGRDLIERWPVAALVTLVTMRDTRRRADGFTWPTTCEFFKTAGLILLIIFMVFFVTAGALLFRMLCMNRCRLFMQELEERLCPKRMLIPSKFEHH